MPLLLVFGVGVLVGGGGALVASDALSKATTLAIVGGIGYLVWKKTA